MSRSLHNGLIAGCENDRMTIRAHECYRRRLQRYLSSRKYDNVLCTDMLTIEAGDFFSEILATTVRRIDE